MLSFRNYVNEKFGDYEQDQQIVNSINEKLDAVSSMEQDIQSLVNRLTQGHEAVQHATTHFMRSLQSLKATVATAVLKNTNSPEMADHNPRSIEVS